MCLVYCRKKVKLIVCCLQNFSKLNSFFYVIGGKRANGFVLCHAHLQSIQIDISCYFPDPVTMEELDLNQMSETAKNVLNSDPAPSLANKNTESKSEFTHD